MVTTLAVSHGSPRTLLKMRMIQPKTGSVPLGVASARQRNARLGSSSLIPFTRAQTGSRCANFVEDRVDSLGIFHATTSAQTIDPSVKEDTEKLSRC